MTIRKPAIIFITIFLLRSFAFAELTVPQIMREYSKSVVTIIALDENDQPLSLGSGFFINDIGYIATNRHVLEGSVKAIIKTLDGERGEVLKVIRDDPDLDLLIASTSLQNTRPIPLGDSDTITVGEDIVAIGNPAGLEGTVSRGIISGVRKAEGFKFIQITAPISPGSSGGPVFNLTGKVIGIATAYLVEGQNLNFAMPVNYLKSLKLSGVNLASLPKIKPQSDIPKRDINLVRAFDIHYKVKLVLGDLVDWDLQEVVFSIKNESNYRIRNIRVFFVYRNATEKVVSYSTMLIKDSILPKLALQFAHNHEVRYWQRGLISGSVEIRILDYQIDRPIRPIRRLPIEPEDLRPVPAD